MMSRKEIVEKKRSKIIRKQRKKIPGSDADALSWKLHKRTTPKIRWSTK